MSDDDLIAAVVAALGVSQTSAAIYVRTMLAAQRAAPAPDLGAYLNQLGDA